MTQRPEDSDFRSESSSSRQQSREVTLTEAHVNESESVEDKARVAIKVISMEDPQTKPQEKKKLKTFKNNKTSVSKEQTLAIVKDIIAQETAGLKSLIAAEKDEVLMLHKG